MLYMLLKGDGSRVSVSQQQVEAGLASKRFFTHTKSKSMHVIRMGQKGRVPKDLPKAEKRLVFGGTKKCQDFFDHGKLSHNPSRSIAREQGQGLSGFN